MNTRESLARIDNLREGAAGNTPAFLHEDHRWLLPIVFDAQERGLLPRPCTIVMYDAHHDACPPNELGAVRELARAGVTAEALMELCGNSLSTIDDDWVIAGMELGIFKDAVAFGVEYNAKYNAHERYVDWRGGEHVLYSTGSLPGDALEYQGVLSDLVKTECRPLWGALGWKPDGGIFGFDGPGEKIVLDIDLDCFSAKYRDVMFSWPDAVFERELNTVSDYHTTKGWSGRRFFEGLLDRAGIVTVAREHECCGGQDVCDENLRKVSLFMFDGVGGLSFAGE